MKPEFKLFQARLVCAVALEIGSSFNPAAAEESPAGTAPAKASQPIPWSQIGSKAGSDYQGDGLAVSPTADGARLRCVFQRLEGEVTPEGLWLTSTVVNAVNDRFRVVATGVGRREAFGVRRIPALSGPSYAAQNQSAGIRRTPNASRETLPSTGTVTVDGQTVRFTRPGLVEEYSVSMDGVRQDFVVLERPAAAGELALRLAISGVPPSGIEPSPSGARLVLASSGRNIAYSRLRVTDATGKELTARMEVAQAGESQRDSIIQPRVAIPLSGRATLG